LRISEEIKEISKSLKCDYSRIASSYDRYRDLSPSSLSLWLGKIIRWGRISSSAKVLDIGCGTGRLIIPLQQMTQTEVYGLDLSAEMLAQAQGKEGAEVIRWILGDAQALPFPDRFFDCTFMCLVLHHIEDKARAISEMYRVLKPGGRSLIWTTSHHQIKDSLLNEFFPSLQKIDLRRFPPIPTIKGLMGSAGYIDICAEEVTFQEQVRTSDYIEKVRNRYISTLSLIDEEEFAAGTKKLERALPRRYGQRMTRESRFMIVTGREGADLHRALVF
jgi:ubiquinone/menaquinone biosynthesis C-methylase UbiE